MGRSNVRSGRLQRGVSTSSDAARGERALLLHQPSPEIALAPPPPGTYVSLAALYDEWAALAVW